MTETITLTVRCPICGYPAVVDLAITPTVTVDGREGLASMTLAVTTDSVIPDHGCAILQPVVTPIPDAIALRASEVLSPEEARALDGDEEVGA